MRSRHWLVGLLRTLVFVVVGIVPGVLADQARGAEYRRIVSAGGAVTEIVFALGAGDRLVGVDSTSRRPEAARRLPQVGYFRALAAEGVLALEPDLLLTVPAAGPPRVIEQIRAAGVKVATVPDDKTPEGVVAKVRAVAAVLGLETEGERLSARIEAGFRRLARARAAFTIRPKVAFLMTVARGAPLAGGRDTAADAIIRLAGGSNAFSGFNGYKPVGIETLFNSAPEVLLVTERLVAAIGGRDAVWNLPGLRLTPAGLRCRLVVMDALDLLGFGPRTPEVALELLRRLHPQS